MQNYYNNNYTSAYLHLSACLSACSTTIARQFCWNIFLRKNIKYIYHTKVFFKILGYQDSGPTIFFLIAINFDTEILKTSSSLNGDMCELYY